MTGKTFNIYIIFRDSVSYKFPIITSQINPICNYKKHDIIFVILNIILFGPYIVNINYTKCPPYKLVRYTYLIKYGIKVLLSKKFPRTHVRFRII